MSLAKTLTSVAMSAALVIIGAGLAIGHGGSGNLLHSQHNDVMNGTLTARNVRYRSPRARHLSISNLAFNPETDVTYDNDALNGLTSTSGGCFNAGLPLPDDSVIRSVRFSYTAMDNLDFEARLIRKPLLSTPGHVLATDFGLQTSSSPEILGLTLNHLVDAKLASYGLQVCFSGLSTALHGVRVTYTVRHPS